jgi:hypothetical protein
MNWSNWSPESRQFLERLLDNGPGRHLPIVFDFDNTIICGDIGEATFAILVRDGVLIPEKIPNHLSPGFRLPSGDQAMVRTSSDLISYYEALQKPAAHGHRAGLDPAPFSTAYVWVAQIMAGLTPLEVVNATAKAFAISQPGRLVAIELAPGQPSYPAPFFYTASVELIAEFLRQEFEVWICSASNVWAVRWMVLNALNPLLLKEGLSRGIAPEKVIGISLLLQDNERRLYKDPWMVRDNRDYGTLRPEVLRDLKLTSVLHHPVPTASGKVACIWEQIGRAPYLAIGDSPGDLPMLTFSMHRLWLARPEKPGYQTQAAAAMQATGRTNWCIQPTEAFR